ncbi:MAG: hypothetical protein ACXAEU_21980 [Candidatus Hodarchaeales archaeon]
MISMHSKNTETDVFIYEIDGILSNDEIKHSQSVYELEELSIHACSPDGVENYWFFITINNIDVESDIFSSSDCYYLFFDVFNDHILDTNDIALRISLNESLIARGSYEDIWWFVNDNLNFFSYKTTQKGEKVTLELLLLETTLTRELFLHELNFGISYYLNKHDAMILPDPIDVNSAKTYITIP